MRCFTCKLKQHTPLIHFQHDQEGATLRASEVKPKLDKYILSVLGNGNYQDGINQAKINGWLIGKGDHPALDYKVRIIDNTPDNLFSITPNEKRVYTESDERRDRDRNYTIMIVNEGDIILHPNIGQRCRYVILKDGKRYFGKLRKKDSKIIYDLSGYPLFFANLDSDITDATEYKNLVFAEDPFEMVLRARDNHLLDFIKQDGLLSSFFMTHNFGMRQSKGFGSFYLDEDDPLYKVPSSRYYFNLQINEANFSAEFYTLFKDIELFSRTLRAGINEKRGARTVFYFKSLAFIYCKNVLNAEWDKKRVKTEFYFDSATRRNDSLEEQRYRYPNNDDNYDILFYDATDGYDIRDLMGFSTNEEWQSYKDSIEKKIALKDTEDSRLRFPTRDDSLPVERMRSPLLVKPICRVGDDGSVQYNIYLVFQDNLVGMEEFKRHQKICFYSKREIDNNTGRPKRFMIDLPANFSMESYFDYILGPLNFDISEHIEERFQEHEFYYILKDIYSQLKDNLSV